MRYWQTSKQDLIITKHGKQRCKSRLGISKKSVSSLAKRALKYGLRHYELNGNLKSYIIHLYKSHNEESNNIILFKQNVFIFKYRKLITVFRLPDKYLETYERLYQKKLSKREIR